MVIKLFNCASTATLYRGKTGRTPK